MIYLVDTQSNLDRIDRLEEDHNDGYANNDGKDKGTVIMYCIRALHTCFSLNDNSRNANVRMYTVQLLICM